VVLLETIEHPGQLQAYFSEDNFSEIKKNDEVITVKQGTLAEMEEELVKVMFSKFGYNKSELANKLNISRSTLWRIKEQAFLMLKSHYLIYELCDTMWRLFRLPIIPPHY
jgi:transcriptional regulator with PAS, ATPase and Fis domain